MPSDAEREICEEIMDALVDIQRDRPPILKCFESLYLHCNALETLNPYFFIRHPKEFLSIADIDERSEIGERLLYLHFRRRALVGDKPWEDIRPKATSNMSLPDFCTEYMQRPVFIDPQPKFLKGIDVNKDLIRRSLENFGYYKSNS